MVDSGTRWSGKVLRKIREEKITKGDGGKGRGRRERRVGEWWVVGVKEKRGKELVKGNAGNSGISFPSEGLILSR